MKWEYLLVEYNENIVQNMNIMGLAGWEVIDVRELSSYVRMTMSVRVWYKRELVQGNA